MPNYDYQCLTCERTWVEQRKIAERNDVLPCPACDGLDVVKLDAAPAISHVYGGYGKVPEGFKDVLRRIKKNNVGSLIEV